MLVPLGEVINKDDKGLAGFINPAHRKRVALEACAMEPSDNYVIAPDGEIVKVLEGNYEYTGMYVVD